MPYDEGLAVRIRSTLEPEPGVEEREMFGGICFLLDGNMACGVIGDDLILRVGKEAYEAALEEEHTKPFDFTGRPMTGWVVIVPEGFESRDQLEGWLRQGVSIARSLPPK